MGLAASATTNTDFLNARWYLIVGGCTSCKKPSLHRRGPEIHRSRSTEARNHAQELTESHGVERSAQISGSIEIARHSRCALKNYLAPILGKFLIQMSLRVQNGSCASHRRRPHRRAGANMDNSCPATIHAHMSGQALDSGGRAHPHFLSLFTSERPPPHRKCACARGAAQLRFQTARLLRDGVPQRSAPCCEPIQCVHIQRLLWYGYCRPSPPRLPSL